MTRRLLAIALAIHGLIHVIGFVVPWRLVSVEGIAYRTSAFGGRIDLGDVGARLVGLAWLPLAVLFLVAAYGVWRSRTWAWSLTVVAATVSFGLCVVGIPDTIYGLVMNTLILGIAGRYASDHGTVLNRRDKAAAS
jgi:hypothetical protein